MSLCVGTISDAAMTVNVAECVLPWRCCSWRGSPYDRRYVGHVHPRSARWRSGRVAGGTGMSDRQELLSDHPWVGILGHPDDEECSECGQPEHRHEETTR